MGKEASARHTGLASLAQTAPSTDLVAGTQFTYRHRAVASFNLLDYPVRIK